MKRISVALAATSMLAVHALGTSTAQAAPSGPAPVKNAHLPTVAEAVAAVPALTGTTRIASVERAVGGPGKTCTDEKTFRADRGRMAVYLPEDFSPEDSANGSLAVVHVARFAKPAKAKQLVANHQRFVRKCAGVKTKDGTASRLALPALGQQRVGIRFESKRPKMSSTYTIVRRGGTVVITMLASKEKVTKADTVALTKLAVRKSR